MKEDLTTLRRIDRLDIYANYKGYNDNKITHDTGISIGTLGKSRKEGKDITGRTCEAILSRYPELNRVWLMSGEGEMIISDDYDSSPSYPVVEDIAAECGQAEGIFDASSFSNFSRMKIPGVPRDTEFFIRATGYSMVDNDHPEMSIPPGSLIGISKMKGGIRWGETYAIATPDGIMIKRILPDNDKNKILCVSYNSTDYPPFTLSRTEIRDIARITCVVPLYIR